MKPTAKRETVLWNETRLANPHEQSDKAMRVRRMFDAIAPTYERVNSLFSGGRDRVWRQRSVELVGTRSTDRVLDVACGTGDFARAFLAAESAPRAVVGCDFSPGMLQLAARRDAGRPPGGLQADPNRKTVSWVLSDAQRLPFVDASFSIVSCAFGVRNLQNLDMGLAEMHRVLRPEGRAVILEFTIPRRPIWQRLYRIYATRIMPRGASWLSGDRTGAYRYLPKSVESFVASFDLIARLRAAGFGTTTAHEMTFGVVTAFVAQKDST